MTGGGPSDKIPGAIIIIINKTILTGLMLKHKQVIQFFDKNKLKRASATTF